MQLMQVIANIDRNKILKETKEGITIDYGKIIAYYYILLSKMMLMAMLTLKSLIYLIFSLMDS